MFANTPSLWIQQQGQPPRQFPLTRSTVNIGQARNNDLILEGRDIAPQHTQLLSEGEYYYLLNLGHPIWVNQQRLRQQRIPISPSDSIRIGSYSLTLSYPQAPTQVSRSIRGPIVPSAIPWPTGTGLCRIGRDPQNDIVLDHPTVSRFHAEIYPSGSHYLLNDLGSTNGTFLLIQQSQDPEANAQFYRIHKPYPIFFGNTLKIGSVLVEFAEDIQVIRIQSFEAIHLNKYVSKTTNLLQDISLSFQTGQLIAIVGVAGGGKSTLMDALSGFRPGNHGSQVLINGIDFYQNYEAFQPDLGYVPQKNIIHDELTVWQALDFSAQLRLPSDTTPSERHQRVQEVLTTLNLIHRKDLRIRSLSGGQQRRMCMAVELITEPTLFFLDEVTSGLDPVSESDVMHLLKQLASQNKIIFLITHSLVNLDLCDRVVFLARGGNLAYFGDPSSALCYFQVRDFHKIYERVEKEKNPEDWRQSYLLSPDAQTFLNPTIPMTENMGGQVDQPVQSNASSAINPLRQFWILLKRNVLLLKQDSFNLGLVLSIPLILGSIDFVWGRQVFDGLDGDPQMAMTMLFASALIPVMVGGFTTMREIVREGDIFKRERSVGVKVLPYMCAKLGLAVGIAFYQALVFFLLKQVLIDSPGFNHHLWATYFTLVLSTLSGMTLGLLVSAISPNQNVTPLILILLLVPQIVFGGGTLPIDKLRSPFLQISQLTPTHWAFSALVTLSEIGLDIAEDPCWQMDEATRPELSTPDKIDCQCLGANLFEQCAFPGILQQSAPAITQDPPPEPDPPSDPRDPAQLTVYNDSLEVWQADYTRWNREYETAIASGEATITRFEQDFGSIFKVNIRQTWLRLVMLIIASFGLATLAQYFQDLWMR